MQAVPIFQFSSQSSFQKSGSQIPFAHFCLPVLIVFKNWSSMLTMLGFLPNYWEKIFSWNIGRQLHLKYTRWRIYQPASLSMSLFNNVHDKGVWKNKTLLIFHLNFEALLEQCFIISKEIWYYTCWIVPLLLPLLSFFVADDRISVYDFSFVFLTY